MLQKRNIGTLFGRFLMPGKIRTRTWWSGTSSAPRNFWDVPEITRRWNEKISGDPQIPYYRHIGNYYLPGNTPLRLLSPGCGTGHKELVIAAMWPQWQITAFDTSANRIEIAKQAAREKTITNISFLLSDIAEFNCAPSSFDIILFDSSLHHFSSFDLLFARLKKALAPEGMVVINEYVGPDRFQWTKEQLDMANDFFSAIPRELRRRLHPDTVKRRIYRPGYLRMLFSDPSEAVQSSQILPALHRHFTTVQEVPLGGNLLHLVLKDIAHHFTATTPVTAKLLDDLLKKEDLLLKDHPADFVFGMYKNTHA